MYELEKHIHNGVAFFYVWSGIPWSREDLIRDASRKDVHTIVVFAHEEWETLHIGTTHREIKDLIKKIGDTKLHIFYGGVKHQMNKRQEVALSPYYESWINYFAHVVVDRHHQINFPLRNPKMGDLKKHFVSMNGRPHYHRCMFIDEMYGRGLFDYGYISWHEFDIEDYVDSNEWKYWTPHKMEFDKNFQQTNGICDIFIPPEQFSNSVFSIISESNLNCIFFTEKTWLPIYNQKPILLYTHPYAHQYLKRQGYKLHNNIIDYSFDHVEDDEKRLMMFMDQVEKICTYDVNELFNHTLSVAIHNRNMLLKHVKQRKFVPDSLIKICEKFKNQDQIEYYHRVLNIGDYIEKAKE